MKKKKIYGKNNKDIYRNIGKGVVYGAAALGLYKLIKK